MQKKVEEEAATTMNREPARFSDFGKFAREILYKDYNYDRKVSITYPTADGFALTASSLQMESDSFGDVAAQYKYKNAVLDVKVDTKSGVATTLTLTDVRPSVKSIASVKLPYLSTAKVHTRYFHEYATIGSSVSLRNFPKFDVSATRQTGNFVLGVEAGYDTSTGDFTKCNAAITTLASGDYCTTLTLADKGDLLTLSYVRFYNLARTTTVVEVSNRFSEDGSTLTVGGAYAYDDSTLIKLKLNSKGKFGALLQHEFRPKSVLTMAAEFDYTSYDTNPKCGFSLALKL